MKENLLFLFISGLVLGSGPCIGFCAPILAGYVAAYRTSLRKAVISYVVFSAAKLVSYMIIGALCAIFADILNSVFFEKYLYGINIILGAFVLLIGISIFIPKQAFFGRYCSFLHTGNIKNVGVLGFLAGFSPCLPFFGILNYIIAVSHSPFQSVLFTFVFGLGTSISPILLFVAFSGKLAGDFSKYKLWATIIKFGSAFVLFFLGAKIILQTLLR